MKWEDVATAAQKAVMEVQMKRLVNALRFYGDAKNYVHQEVNGRQAEPSPVAIDEGETARAALREFGAIP